MAKQLKRLSGINPLAYIGVEATVPAQQVSSDRNPTTEDYKGFNLGDEWINTTGNQVWKFMGRSAPTVADWIEMASTSGVGASNFVTDSGTAVDLLGTINVLGGSNVNTDGSVANTVTINLDDTVSVSGSITAGTGLTATTGNITATSGDITAVAGDVVAHGGVSAITGNIISTLGDIETLAGNIQSALNIRSVGGNIVVSGGNIELPFTNASATWGVIEQNNAPFLHSYGDIPSANLFLGRNAGNFSLTVATAVNNIGIGRNSLSGLTTGAGNIAIGNSAGISLTSAQGNVIIGAAAGSNMTGSSNLVIGASAGQALTSGQTNVFVGAVTGFQLTTGSDNTLIGNGSGSDYTGAESSNILINNDGVVGESNVIRIGTTGTGAGEQEKCFIAGIRGVTTDVNDAVAVLIDSAGQLGTVSSSRVYKENIVEMSDDYKVMDLRPVEFSYKSDARHSKHLGLIAEEVEQLVPELVVYNEDKQPETVKYHILPVLLLKELQKLEKRVSALELVEKHCTCRY